MADSFEQWPADIAFGLLGDLIGYAIRRAQIGIYKDFDASVTGLTPPLFAALILIDANPGINQSRLGQVMGVNRAAMMALLDRLSALKLVRRVPSPSDKRANVLQLTALGQKCRAEASAEVRAHDARIARNLTTAELKTLRRLLKKF
ncbi:MarR family winged helix-turn-helix transcriptional regulator [Dongia rigui]|uniref:MarR family winged helix-turn-helix transcriptional regulator n=1 Tax=Dongia rigui TaxID=940149 RepID=A0ABU5DVL0_9PROT|nr:MarR family winged helix-turn-helix transcriptional regulator [Dongia rigui]MDY0871346.1 MarR family winged helix-turn-helix transcriptional regulator [Dongia rigui]